ncbi:MAG: acetate/propionate family kinase [Alphaproteobacteria bacterium]|nr:acetate/propionate family kinase [Alphaproteobacteria bacterium]
MDTSSLETFLSTRVPLFRDFPKTHMAELLAKSHIHTFEPNEPILRFGDVGRFFGVLLEGQIEVSVTDDGGTKHRLGVLDPGDIFGEMELMTGDATVADVTGMSVGSALLIDENAFATVLAVHPPAIRYLSKLVSVRTRQNALSRNNWASSVLRHNDDPYGFKLKSTPPMRLLIINNGSSSLKYNFYDTGDESRNTRGMIERIGEEGTRLVHHFGGGEIVRNLPKGGHAEAFAAMGAQLIAAEGGVLTGPDEITAVGHRVVHGGDKFSTAALVTDEVEQQIETLSVLAPLHNPINLIGIREAKRLFPLAQQVAVFDTSFHQTLPPYAFLYGLPYSYYQDKGIRRYGFHGMSHSYVGLMAAQTLKRPFNELQIVSCHLGNGASACAIDHGRSIDTSMGLTPAEGLIMGTRSGSMDPTIPLHLIRQEGMDVAAVDRLINREGGLKGLSGLSNDMRTIEKAAAEGHHLALLAFKTFCYQLRKTIGAYVAAMGGLDVLTFTGGIGQGSAGVRSLACQGLSYMGIVIDEERNRSARGFSETTIISTADSTVTVLVVPTDEERMIARETMAALDRAHISGLIRKPGQDPVPVEVSAHHVHLSQEHVEALFGFGHTLTHESDLSQPGQFAAKECVSLIGPKGRVDGVRVLGPARSQTQIEIAMTEQFKLGIHPPIRESGDLGGTPGLTLEGPAGKVTIERGVICAHRHIHMSPDDAMRFGLRDKYQVRVKVKSGADRELIFGDVLVRVHPDYRLAMHIDTDEGNAAGIISGAQGYVDEIERRNA